MKIVLIDDHEIILESLSLLLGSLPEVDRVVTFEHPVVALEHCLAEKYDLIITDNNMPEMTGCAFTLKLRKEKPESKILMLTIDEHFGTIREAFSAGILGYVMKKANKRELREAVLTVASGKRFVSDAVFSELIRPDGPSHWDQSDDLQSLSSREIEIVALIGQELSSKEIAERLFVSVATVEKHRHNILKKLGVKNSIGIVKYALGNGLLD
ncbi:response regulator transcription factor [Marinilongibacter aquaticus]|uniref:response regulator n=1 Tax=Marinilongibacter aquaticus TaxID=2975157 RepID=UPI0021BD7F0D|nr:response regulator transcription factor [Marinilongibacter aquaticus]UBM58803.1 response regulator transcription factor [Marinilongibacter aquaticus]